MVSKILIIAILLKARIINNCIIFYSNIFQYIFTPIYFFLPLAESGFIMLLKIDTELNNADLLSKALFAKDFQFKAQAVQGVQPGDEPIPPPKRK